MADYAKRRRLNPSRSGDPIHQTPNVFPHPTFAPASAADRANWNGFCEIESEPVSRRGSNPRLADGLSRATLTNCPFVKAFFNVILEELGVRGVKVREVISLDREMLELLP